MCFTVYDPYLHTHILVLFTMLLDYRVSSTSSPGQDPYFFLLMFAVLPLFRLSLMTLLVFVILSVAFITCLVLIFVSPIMFMILFVLMLSVIYISLEDLLTQLLLLPAFNYFISPLLCAILQSSPPLLVCHQ